MGDWSHVFITCFPAGMLQCNCYVLAPEQGADAVVVDPGQRAMAPLRRILDENRLTPAAVLLTHGHIDHMWSAQKVADTYGCPAYIHPEDRVMLTDPIKGFGPRLAQLAMSAVFREPRQVVELDRDGDKIDLGGFTVTVDHTPGHTRGSVVFRVAATPGGQERSDVANSTGQEELAFTGDTLFKQSVGRTDLWGGSGRDLLTSIVSKLLVLDDDHRGTTWPWPEVHDRRRASHQPIPRRTLDVSEFQAPKGIPDYLPPDSAQFVAVRDGLLDAARRAGYGHVELPIFEDTALFARGVGESTDVVSKEMYSFADRGDRSVTLRPEGTAGVVRAVIEHGLDRGQLPVKLRYAGPFFRYERPQAGRYRQLQQVGVEAIGVDDPALDAEVIAIADAGFRSLGLTGFRLEITSLGDDTCRPEYRELLQEFLFTLDLDEETRRRAEINPLRVLDDKRPHVREMTADAPLMLDHLSDVAKQHFDTVLANLDALGVPYVINPRMVRGLDYYTKTTFEFVHDGLGAQSGIGGGGRYDGLMKQLGGQDLSGIGFGLGVDRTVLALAAEGKTVGEVARVDVYCVPLGGAAKSVLVRLAGGLRAAGVRVDLAYGDRGMKGAMRAADRSGARIALVAGDRDVEAGTVGVKDLATGEQTDVAVDAVVTEVLTRLT